MVVRTYYSTGAFDTFDTDIFVDTSSFPNNILTNYSFEFEGIEDDKTLWMNVYYYEAVDAYRDGATSPAGLPIARRRDGWSLVLVDPDDVPSLERVTVDGKDALVRQGDEFVYALILDSAVERAYTTNPQAVGAHDYYAAAFRGTNLEPSEEELCRSIGCSQSVYQSLAIMEGKNSPSEGDLA